MKIIPFRIIPNNDEEDFSEIYEFLIKGSSKDAYQVKINIDDINDLGIIKTKCDCIDCSIRRSENSKRFFGKDYKCKHIIFALKILSDIDCNKIDFEKQVENIFLEKRGIKNWEEFDKINKSSKASINSREEIINISKQIKDI